MTDNATGDGVMLELARVLAAHRDQLRRSVVFCFWNGHEIAEAAGSTYFVDSRWDDLSKSGVAYLNIDSPGMKEATYFLANSSAELSRFHGPIEERILGAPGERQPLSRTGDQSFLGVGVPSLTGRYSHRADLVRQWNGATLGWWNHTSQEDLEKVDTELLGREARLWTAYILALATAPVLPQRFTPRAAEFAAKLQATLGDGEDPVDLAAAVALSHQLLERCRDLDAWANRTDADGAGGEAPALAINRALLRMSRHLTAACATVGGKYAQDSYGLSTLYAPVPMLAALARYRSLPVDSVERKLVLTALRRARNQVSDALRAALEEIDVLELRLRLCR